MTPNYRLKGKNSTIILQRLRGKTLGSFRAKSSNITFSVSQIFEELEYRFDKRPDNLVRRRRFAGRAWMKVESFNEYFQDKMIPAENMCLDQGELIDDIPETELRNQARMHSFKSPFDLLKAF